MDASSQPAAAVSTTLADWFAAPLGNYLLTREHAWFDRTVADIFGYHAIQIGLPEYAFLAQSRIATRWTVDYDAPAQLRADPHWLPFAENALDLIVLPHALEFTTEPHQLLREAYRTLRPEGQIVISGFNPFSAVRRQALLRPRAGAPVERQFHRALPAQGLAGAARIRGHRRRSRLLRPAVSQPGLARALRLLRVRRRPLVADRRRRLLPARDQERDRHAGDHAGVAAAQADAGSGTAAGARVHRAAGRPVSAAGHPEGDAASARRDGAPATDVVTIHTDGACKGNPGPGGWGALLQWGSHRRELFGGEAATTNNRMELTAVIRALESLKRDCDVDWSTPTRST